MDSIRLRGGTQQIPAAKREELLRAYSSFSMEDLITCTSSDENETREKNKTVMALHLPEGSSFTERDLFCQSLQVKINAGMNSSEMREACQMLRQTCQEPGNDSYLASDGEHRCLFNLVDAMITAPQLEYARSGRNVLKALGSVRISIAQLDSVYEELCAIDQMMQKIERAVYGLHNWLGEVQAQRVKRAEKKLKPNDFPSEEAYAKRFFKKLRLADSFKGIEAKELARTVPIWLEEPHSLRFENCGQLSEVRSLFGNLLSTFYSYRKSLENLKEHPKAALNEQIWLKSLSLGVLQTGKAKESLKSSLNFLIPLAIRDLKRRKRITKEDASELSHRWSVVRPQSRSSGANWVAIQECILKLAEHLPMAAAKVTEKRESGWRFSPGTTLRRMSSKKSISHLHKR